MKVYHFHFRQLFVRLGPGARVSTTQTMCTCEAAARNRDLAADDVQVRWVAAKTAVPIATLAEIMKGAPPCLS